MLRNQGLMEVSITLDKPRAMDKWTCGLIANHNVYVMFLMNGFDEVRSCILQKRTERIAGKRHKYS